MSSRARGASRGTLPLARRGQVPRLTFGSLGMTLLSLILGIATLWIAIWIYLPAPTYFLLTFGVGGPEVSHWLILGAVLGIALGVPSFAESRVAIAGVLTCSVALLLALGVWVRVPGAIKRFDYAMRGVSAEPKSPLRTTPIA